MTLNESEQKAVAFLDKAFEEQVTFLNEFGPREDVAGYLKVAHWSHEELVKRFRSAREALKNTEQLEKTLKDTVNLTVQVNARAALTKLGEELVAGNVPNNVAYNEITQVLVFDSDSFKFTDYMGRVRSVKDSFEETVEGAKPTVLDFLVEKERDVTKVEY